MIKQEKHFWIHLAGLANNSRIDLNKAIERSESRLSEVYGWRALFTYRIFTIIYLFWTMSKFKKETDELFADAEVQIVKGSPIWAMTTVKDYNKLLNEYRSDILRLFALVDKGTSSDPETRFNAYTHGGRIG